MTNLILLVKYARLLLVQINAVSKIHNSQGVILVKLTQVESLAALLIHLFQGAISV